ncbi:MAG: hypothetical protein WKF31_03840 [Thermoleophilaceae bacterium]
MRVVGLAQVGQAGLGDDERAARVDGLHEVEALDRQVAGRAQVDGARVVHADVDAPEALHGLLDRARYLLLVADVADDGKRRAAGLLDLLRGGVDGPRQLRVRLVGLRHDRHVHPVLGQARWRWPARSPGCRPT